ncbi:MAG: DUF2203 domain-containing protein [bacterium]|nr:DUF2203 domain-containing protein [Gemmatimonadota bacterium]
MVKTYTAAEANRTLPYVRSVVADILEKARELRGKTSLSPDPENDDELELLQQDLLSLMEELEKIGASFKDWNFEVGLVDFPGQVRGEEVMFCWRSDEDAVLWYHSADEGFAGRQRIPEDELPEDLRQN